MKKKVYFLLLLIVFSYFVYSAKSPATFEVSGTSCTTSTCLVGQKAAFDLTITPHGENAVTNFWIESAAIDQNTLKITPRQNSPAKAVSFALKDTLDERNYSLDINAEIDTSGFNGFFWKIQHTLFGDDIFYSQEFRVRYPAVDLELTPVNKGNLQAEYNLKFRNEDQKAFTCKVNFKTSSDIFIEHDFLRKVRENSAERVYESAYTLINADAYSTCCNSILLKANTDEGTSQMEIVPICSIEGTDVIITGKITADDWKHSKKE